jgi:hypothetical protein
MQTIDDIPSAEVQRIKDRLVAQIQSMNAAELNIVAKTEQSLANFVAEVFQSIASLMGYIIALPIAYGIRIAKSMVDGFSSGWDAAFKNAGL